MGGEVAGRRSVGFAEGTARVEPEVDVCVGYPASWLLDPRIATLRRATPARFAVFRVEFALMNAYELPDGATLSACATCCGSFGELLQGVLPGGEHFLVTLPIDLHAQAHFKVSRRIHGLQVWPEHSWKALRLVEAMLRRYDLPLRGKLHLESAIPRGKGLASSTADLVATYRAVACCYHVPQQHEVLEALLRDIEPSDGVMHRGVVAYRHREARLHEHLGAVPALTLVAVDEGGEVQTLAHNGRRLDYSAAERDEYATLLSRLRHALECGDIAALGAVATRSAYLNQRVLPKRCFDAMTSIAAAVQAAGVVAAHSGTCLAIIIDALGADHDAQVRRAVSLISAKGLKPALFSSLSSAGLRDQRAKVSLA
jgi:uncharacterized protein involved in propanediol utilization